MNTNRRKALLQVFFLVLIFALPALLSSYLYFFGDDLMPEGSVNMGSLVQPARPLPDQTLFAPGGEETPLSSVFGKWTIVVMAERDCGDHCRSRLHDMDKVRQALGEDSQRAQTLLMVDRPDERSRPDLLIGELPRLRVMTGGARGFPPSLRALFDIEAPPWGRTFIVDPLGNLMMYYPAGSDPKWVLIDMRRLLKASQIG